MKFQVVFTALPAPFFNLFGLLKSVILHFVTLLVVAVLLMLLSVILWLPFITVECRAGFKGKRPGLLPWGLQKS
jgi:hypothetical protein